MPISPIRSSTRAAIVGLGSCGYWRYSSRYQRRSRWSSSEKRNGKETLASCRAKPSPSSETSTLWRSSPAAAWVRRRVGMLTIETRFPTESVPRGLREILSDRDGIQERPAMGHYGRPWDTKPGVVALREAFGTLENPLGTLRSSVGTLRQRPGTLRNDLGTQEIHAGTLGNPVGTQTKSVETLGN